MRKLMILFITVMVLGSASLFAGGAAEEEVKLDPDEIAGTITLWTWDAPPENLLKAFYSKYPDIEIEVVNVESKEMMKKIQTTIASGGELPHLVRINNAEYAGRIMEMGLLEDLEASPYNLDGDVLIDASPYRNDKGELLAVPEDIAVAGLAYKTNLTEKYFGISEPDELEAMFPTWDDFIEKGKYVAEQSNGDVFMLPSLFDVYITIAPQSGKIVVENDQFLNEPYTEVIAKVLEFRDAGIVDKLTQWTPAWNASYADDKHIFYPAALWSPRYAMTPNDPDHNGRWRIMVPPEGGFVWGGSSHGILKGSNEKGKQLAAKFIDFAMLSEEGAKAFKKDGAYTHFAPVYENPEHTEWRMPVTGDQNIGEKYFVDIIQTVFEPPFTTYDMLLGRQGSIPETMLEEANRKPELTAEDILDKTIERLRSEAPQLISD